MFNEYENTLRTIIILVLGDKDDATFGVTPDRILIWREKRETENKKKKDIQIENRLIYYSDFYDLQTILNKNWEKFKPILIDKKRFEVFNSEIENYRNNIAHGREVLSFQMKIMEGIIGDLKNQLVLYHSKNTNPDDFFIKILRVSDSLGHMWEKSQMFDSVITKSILKVGDKIEFFVDAFDPKGREIEYRVQLINDYIITQSSNKIIVEIVPDMISKSCHFRIIASTKSSGYRNEESIYFNYTVIP